MASTHPFHAFLAHLGKGDILATFEAFYADDVAMAENQNPPTAGKAANREREIAFLSNVGKVNAFTVGAHAAEGDSAFYECTFDFETKDGTRVVLNQVAVQRWRDGKVVHERFYYNAAK